MSKIVSITLSPTNGSNDVTVRCQSCGVESTWVEAFHKSYKSFDRARQLHNYCPRCWAKWEEREQRIHIALFAIPTLAGVLAIFFFPDPELPWFCANVALWGCFLVALSLPHEAGHAVASWLVGARVYAITFGSGRTIWEGRVGRLELTVGASGLGSGLTWLALPDTRFARAKRILITAAGPLVHVAFIGMGLYMGWIDILFEAFSRLFDADPSFPRVLNVFRPGAAFVIANVFMLIGCLFVKQIKIAGVEYPTDGTTLYRLMSGRGEVNEELEYYLMEIMRLGRCKRYAECIDACKLALKKFPQDATLLNLRAYALYCMKQFAESRYCWLKVVQSCQCNTSQQLTLLDNIAATDLLLGGEGFIAEANSYTEQTTRTAPWEARYQATRGCVLIELGKMDEGRAILHSAILDCDLGNQALCHCYLALADAREGQLDKSQAKLEAARQVKSDSVFIETIEKKMAEVES